MPDIFYPLNWQQPVYPNMTSVTSPFFPVSFPDLLVFCLLETISYCRCNSNHHLLGGHFYRQDNVSLLMIVSPSLSWTPMSACSTWTLPWHNLLQGVLCNYRKGSAQVERGKSLRRCVVTWSHASWQSTDLDHTGLWGFLSEPHDPGTSPVHWKDQIIKRNVHNRTIVLLQILL